MSSWKTYGGTDHSEQISAESLTVKNLVLQKPYSGVFDISGGLHVSGNTETDNVIIYDDSYLYGNTIIGTNEYQNLSVYSTTKFIGPVVFEGDSVTTGNIVSLKSLVATESVYLKDAIYFGNAKLDPVQTIYYDTSGIGINQLIPKAALDISSNQLYSISVISSNRANESVLAQNCSGQSITVGVDTSNAHIRFYYDSSFSTGRVDGFIAYHKGGTMTIDVSENVIVSSKMTIAYNNDIDAHINNETLAVYDISSGFYHPAIYGNSQVVTGSAATFVTSDFSSNTFVNITTPEGKGFMIGGGAYAGDLKRAAGIIGVTGNLNPAQMIVAGNSVVKYFSTTGLNTYKPRTDQYVLDINGPIHVDNGDITSVVQTPFEIYQLSMARNNRQYGVGIGSSIDISTNVATYYREQLIKTTDYGQTWNTIDLSYDFLNYCDSFTSVQMIDAGNCFIAGNTTLAFTNDIENSWSTITITNAPNDGSVKYNHLFINPVPKSDGVIYGYCAVDSSSTMITFEYDISNNEGASSNSTVVDASKYIDTINYIQASSNSIYLAGNAIVKYNATTSSIPIYGNTHVYKSYTYNQVKVFDNSYVIGVGNNLISSTTDGGLTWTDISFNVNFRSVHMIDTSNAIACGWYGNIWITGNKGKSWNQMPNNLINTSGKSDLITSNNNRFEDITMTDVNTILLVNTIQKYNLDTSSNGISNILNVFTPNYMNRSNNVVLDISGTVNVSGDLKVNDNGSVITTNASMNLFNTTVQNIQFGGDATQITIGNTMVGNIISRTNVIINKNLAIAGKMDVSGNATINGNVLIAKTTTINGNTTINANLIVNGISTFTQNMNLRSSDIVIDTGSIYVRNVLPNVEEDIRLGGPNNNIYIGGVINNNEPQNIRIGQSDPLGGNESKVSTIYIGGRYDNVILQGNTRILNIQQSIIQSPTTIVNAPVVGRGANVTSAGAGIDIFDNSYASPSPSNNVYGYVHVGIDMQSFIFKAPSYGSYMNPINKTGPLMNTYGNIQLISPENRVRLGVNELTLKDISNNIRRGLVVLQPNEDYKKYQADRGHKYFDDARWVDDADYVMNLCPEFDVSNILLKNFDTMVGTQNIGTNLTIGNLSSGSSLFVYGNTTTYGNLITLGNVIVTTMTFPNGNLYIPKGNVGIGTVYPQYPLDISGTTRVFGPLISTNYDTVRFPSNYGSQWIDTVNTASSGSYYQDVAMSYDGQYQYGLLYNKSTFGSVNVSSNYGSSWTATPLPSSYSGNIIYQAVPYLTSNTQTFLFNQLNQNTWLTNAQPLIIQVGTYIASGSSFATSRNYWNGFSSNTSDYWSASTAPYTGTSSSYVGSIITNNSGSGSPYISGEYIQILLPYAFVINYVQMRAFSGQLGSFPKSISVFGSNNGNNWFLLPLSSSNFTMPTDITPQTAIITNSSYYSYYRFVIQSVQNSSSVAISSINLSGFVQNTTGASSYSMAASGSGKTVLVANQGYISGNGNLYLSNDYGQSFTDKGTKAVNGLWQGVAVSQTGSYQAACSINPSGSSNIWLSTNSGSSWAPSIGITNGWQSIAMNSTGQYITAIQAGNVTANAGNIWVSSDYGSSWTSSQKIYNYASTSNSFANQSSTDFNKTVHISTNGRYQTALGLSTSDNIINGDANIWTNSNYGKGIWTDTGVSVPVISGNVSIFSSITMTGGGQHQIASYISCFSGTSFTSGGSYLKSTNYGVTWSGSNFITPSEKVNNIVYNGFFPKLETSANGQYIIGVTKYQDISGNTYNNTNSTAPGIGNIFASSITTVNKLFASHYMGSSYLGNVSSTHGLQIAVNHMSNASLMMGYDTAWDSAYINSADEYAQNALCLNVNGGPVGIGKITPAAISLDVSGNVNIDGGVTIGGTTTFALGASFTSISVNSSLVNSNTVVISDSNNAGNKMNFVGSLSAGVDSAIAIANDTGIIFGSSQGVVSGGLVLAPFNNSKYGMRITPTGNVGIGTSIAEYPLRIQGASGTLLKLVNNTSGYASGQSNIEFWDNSSNYNLAKISTIDLAVSGIPQSAIALSAGYNSNMVEGLRIVGQTNIASFVGIGTPVPSYTLDISGGDLRVASTNTSVGTLRLGSQSAYIQSGSRDMTIMNRNVGNIYLGTNNGNVVTIVSDSVSINGNTNISGNTMIYDITNSSSATSGALVVSGGVGVGGNIYAVGVLNTTGNIYVTSTSQSTIGSIKLNTGGVPGTMTCGNIVTTDGSTSINNIKISGNTITGPNNVLTLNSVKIDTRALSNITTISAGTGSSSIGGVTLSSSILTNVDYISTGTNTSTSTISNVTLTNGALSDVTTISTGSNTSTSKISMVTFTNGVISTGTNTSASTISYVTFTNGVISTGTNTSASTISNVTLTNGALSDVTTITATGKITAATSGDTINGIIINSGALSGVSTISASGKISFTNGTTASASASAITDATLKVTGGVGISDNLFVINQTNSGTFNATSDYRAKTNVQPLLPSRTIDALKPVEYDMKYGYQMGFIAHEVQEVFPFLVTGDKDGESMQSLNYNGFIAVLVKEIQDLKKENILLKTRIEALDERLTRLEKNA